MKPKYRYNWDTQSWSLVSSMENQDFDSLFKYYREWRMSNQQDSYSDRRNTLIGSRTLFGYGWEL